MNSSAACVPEDLLEDALPLYPVIISFVQTVRGQNFIARVHGDARVLIEEQDGEWICSGVNPGGISESGATPRDAGLAFRHVLGVVLNDLSEAAGDFSQFRLEATQFVETLHDANLAKWREAVSSFRTGQAQPNDGVEDLPRRSAESVKGIRIETAALPDETLPEFDASVAIEERPKAA
jgi:hypothetical protein